MTEDQAHRDALLAAVLRERFPTEAEMRREKTAPVPPVLVEDRRPYRRGGSGLTHLETLLLKAKRDAA
jgi:hypothetical protein